MTRETVARKYAHGLFAAGAAQHELDALYDEAESLLAYLRQERRLLSFLTAPQIRDQDKERVVRETFTKRVSRTFLSFLLFLVEKHRIGYLDDILDRFIGMVKEHHGILPTKVLSAVPLSGAQRKQHVQTALAVARLALCRERGYRRMLTYIEVGNRPSLAVWQRKLGCQIVGYVDFVRIGPWRRAGYEGG